MGDEKKRNRHWLDKIKSFNYILRALEKRTGGRLTLLASKETALVADVIKSGDWEDTVYVQGEHEFDPSGVSPTIMLRPTQQIADLPASDTQLQDIKLRRELWIFLAQLASDTLEIPLIKQSTFEWFPAALLRTSDRGTACAVIPYFNKDTCLIGEKKLTWISQASGDACRDYLTCVLPQLSRAQFGKFTTCAQAKWQGSRDLLTNTVAVVTLLVPVMLDITSVSVHSDLVACV